MNDIQLIQSRIYEIRGQKLMLDFDLAELYQVETRILNQSVKRNINRFPDDFMFRLTESEWGIISSQFVMTSMIKPSELELRINSRPIGCYQHRPCRAASRQTDTKTTKKNWIHSEWGMIINAKPHEEFFLFGSLFKEFLPLDVVIYAVFHDDKSSLMAVFHSHVFC